MAIVKRYGHNGKRLTTMDCTNTPRLSSASSRTDVRPGDKRAAYRTHVEQSAVHGVRLQRHREWGAGAEWSVGKCVQPQWHRSLCPLLLFSPLSNVSISQADIAPTMLKLLGLEQPKEMDGACLFVDEEAFEQEHPRLQDGKRMVRPPREGNVEAGSSGV